MTAEALDDARFRTLAQSPFLTSAVGGGPRAGSTAPKLMAAAVTAGISLDPATVHFTLGQSGL